MNVSKVGHSELKVSHEVTVLVPQYVRQSPAAVPLLQSNMELSHIQHPLTHEKAAVALSARSGVKNTAAAMNATIAALRYNGRVAQFRGPLV